MVEHQRGAAVTAHAVDHPDKGNGTDGKNVIGEDQTDTARGREQ